MRNALLPVAVPKLTASETFFQVVQEPVGGNVRVPTATPFRETMHVRFTVLPFA